MQLARSLPAKIDWRYIGLAPVVALGVLGLLWASNFYPGLNGDWMSYRATLDRLLSGGPLYPPFQAAPYGLFDVAWGNGYVYPPTSAWLLPLTTWIWPWRVLNLAVLLGGTWAATRNPLAVGLMLAFPATWAGWANGNVMPLIVGMYGLTYGMRGAWWGVLAGAVKPFAVTLLILSAKRREPIRWPLIAIAGIGIVSFIGGYLPVVLNAEPICDGWPLFISFQCVSPAGAYAVTGLLLLAAMLAPQRVSFSLLCLAPFALAPDWTFVYYLLPWMASLVWLERDRQSVLLEARNV